MRQTEVFMGNRAIWENFNFYFQQFSTSIKKTFSLRVKLGTRL